MLSFLPNWFLGILSSLFVVLNTMFCGGAVTLLVPVKWVLRFQGWRRFWTSVMLSIGNLYVFINKSIHALVYQTEWQIIGLENLHPDRQYLVLSNHQSTVDIPVLQGIFQGLIPFPRFFIKQQLLWVPFLGLALWALDMPVMKRYSREKLRKRPELRVRDLERARQACKQLRDQPLTLLNFAEGTRFSRAKHDQQKSQFEFLLRPKFGGVHAVLMALGDQLEAILDVTIIYPDLETPTFRDLAFGRIRRIQVQVDQLKIGLNGVPTLEEIQGQKGPQIIREWLNKRWIRKDMILRQVQKDGSPDLSHVGDAHVVVPDPV